MTCKFTTAILFLIASNVLKADSNLPKTQIFEPFQATYQVLKDGKVMAEQKTELKQLPNNLFQLRDQTTGTHGMASLTGFKRSETSEFEASKTPWTVTQHIMQQKVAFSKRQYTFKYNADKELIEGQHKKKQFAVSNTEHPISAHMLPLMLSELACGNQKRSFEVAVLKSKKINHYKFTAERQQDNLIKISREYPLNSNKNSHIWLDPSQGCVAVKSLYTNDDSIFETKIVELSRKAVAL